MDVSETSASTVENNCSSDSDDLGDIFSYETSVDHSEIRRQNTNLDKVILSVFWKAGKIGAACYSAGTQQLEIVNDVLDTKPNFSVLKNLVLQLRPTTIISCHSLSSDFLKCVKSIISLNENEDIGSNFSEGYEQLHLYSAKNFKYEVCKRRVLAMRTLSEPANLSDSERFIYLQSMIDLSYMSMVSALGGLLFSLDKTLSRIMLQNPSKTILSIKTLSLDNMVWIDEETYKALQIFSPVAHPSSYKWTSSGHKEKFSIYGLLNRCCSKLGSQHMKVMLTQPTKNIDELNSRYKVIEFCLKPENETIVHNITDCIKNMSNIFHIIIQITRTEATPAQWKTFYRTVHDVTVLGEICHAYANQVKFFKQISDCLDDSLYIISNSINNLIDFDVSLYQGRFVVKAGAIPEIDELKERHENLPRIMEMVAQQELQCLPEEIQSCSLIYVPEIGYLLAIPMWKQTMVETDLNIPQLNFKFKVNDVLHYKSARCEELDEILGDSQLLVLKHETEVMYQLVEYIQNHLSPLLNIINKITQLDCFISFAVVAKELDLMKPEMVSESVIEIVQGRHILQQLCVETFVPNDYYSSNENRIKILTGPNMCGKSVYLKQVALIVYMAHIGSFVPAEGAKIGILDHIHTRIQSVESISVQLSSFVIDLRQMCHCIENSSHSSLLIIDEFGKGTSDIDGLSLLTSYISHFVEQGENCPHIIVSTHFHLLVDVLPQSNMVKLQTLEYLIDGEDIVFLYRLKEGSVSFSFASKIATVAGLPSRTSQRAHQVLCAIKTDGIVNSPSDNRRILLMERRKEFLKKFMLMKKETDEDIAIISQHLNNRSPDRAHRNISRTSV